MVANEKLWQEYRATWDAFARELTELQRLVDAGERNGVDMAILTVEMARLAHNAARDRLAAHLAGKNAAIDALPQVPEESRVRRTARLIWEFSGKPQGTAEKDWLRAERALRSAAAGAR
jgi:hypothetical protein